MAEPETTGEFEVPPMLREVLLKRRLRRLAMERSLREAQVGNVGPPPSYPVERQPESTVYRDLNLGLQRLGERMEIRFASLERTVVSAAELEGQETRRHVTNQSKLTRQELGRAIQECEATVLDCFKYNATKNVRFVATAGAVVFASSLVVSAATGIHLIHPLFALLCLIGCAGFYVMTKVAKTAH